MVSSSVLVHYRPFSVLQEGRGWDSQKLTAWLACLHFLPITPYSEFVAPVQVARRAKASSRMLGIRGTCLCKTRFGLEQSAALARILMCLWHTDWISFFLFEWEKKTPNKKKCIKIKYLSISKRICLRKCHEVEMKDLVLFFPSVCLL